jgi:hypothetical protein
MSIRDPKHHDLQATYEGLLVILCLLLLACGPAAAQVPAQEQRLSSNETARMQNVTKSSSETSKLLFPEHFIRGYTEFDVAPPHNEPDLGRCNQPQPNCGAFARYMMSGYLEIQPFGRTLLKHFYFFYQPRFFFGDNIPQVSYTASMHPLAMEHSLGLGIELPKHFELRITNHGVTSFPPYTSSLGSYDGGPNKQPLGIYNTIGVRWYFGGYGHESSSW